MKNKIKDGLGQRKRNSKSITELLIHCMEQHLKYTEPIEEDSDDDLEINEIYDISELVNRAHERAEGMER